MDAIKEGGSQRQWAEARRGERSIGQHAMERFVARLNVHVYALVPAHETSGKCMRDADDAYTSLDIWLVCHVRSMRTDL